MKQEIKRVLKKSSPFGEKTIITSMKKLGCGEENLNYLIIINNKKYVCRTSIDTDQKRLIKDYKLLKAIESAKIAPKAQYLHKANKSFPRSFMILEYIPGENLDNTKITLNKLRGLAKTLAKVHTFHGQNIPVVTSQRKRHFYWARWLMNEFLPHLQPRYKVFFKDLYKHMHSTILIQEPRKKTLMHGDSGPGNVIKSGNKLHLIDWSSDAAGISDPAKDIGNLITDYGISESQLEFFLKEYSRYRKDKTIKERGRQYALLTYYLYFLFEVYRTFQILRKELNKEYLKKTSAQQHLREAAKQFMNLKKNGLVPKGWMSLEVSTLFQPKPIKTPSE